MEILELFISFTKIGFSGFGGYAMLPLINSEVLSHGWMTAAEISDIIIIAEMTPGPVGVNVATFAGIQAAGFWGAVAANIGILTPTLTLTLLAAVFFEKFKNSRWVRRAMTGIRPACIGLIAATVITLSMANYSFHTLREWCALGIGAVAMVGLHKFRLPIPAVILICAVLGVFLT